MNSLGATSFGAIRKYPNVQRISDPKVTSLHKPLGLLWAFRYDTSQEVLTMKGEMSEAITESQRRILRPWRKIEGYLCGSGATVHTFILARFRDHYGKSNSCVEKLLMVVDAILNTAPQPQDVRFASKSVHRIAFLRLSSSCRRV